MQRVKGNEQHHSSERVEKSAQKKLKTSLTEPALLEMDGKRVPVLDRLSAIKSLVLSQPEPLRTLFLAVFSAIIVRVSYQDSDTRYAKIERVVRPQNVDSAFASKMSDIVGRLPSLLVSFKGCSRGSPSNGLPRGGFYP
jgi:hypothetical protein